VPMRGEEGYGEEGYTVVGKEYYTGSPSLGAVGNALAFLLGILVGGGTAFLLAPQSGPTTRRLIREASSGAMEIAGAAYARAAEKLGTQIARGKTFVREGKPLLTAALEAGRDAFEKEREEKLRALK